MKKKIITFLASLSLILAGCGSTPSGTPGGVSPEPIPEGDVFFTAKNKLYEHHNYTVKVTTTVAEDEQSPYVDRFYNINNKVYYAVNSEYPSFYSGFVYQKNQGYVDFDLMIDGSEVVPSNFYSTDPNKSVSDIYTLAIERVLNGTFTKEGDKYACTERDPIAVMVNLSGFDTTYITAPTKMYATVEDENLVLSCDFTMYYIDETTVEKVIQDGNVKVEFENINNTHNAALEAYIENPTTTFVAKTEWEASDIALFNSYYNNRIPPFIEGSSYSLKVGEYYDGYAQEKFVVVEDYVCGDISSSYGAILLSNGFDKVDNYHYQIKETSMGGSMEEFYYVDMIYTAPSEAYSGGRTVGYYFPNGVFTIKYRYKTKLVESIDSIAKLNTYLSKTKVRDILPAFPDTGLVTKISGFEDRTAYANQYYSPDSPAYLFVTSVSSLIVKAHATKENAIAFINALTPLMEAKGFAKDVNTRYGQISYVDEKNSKVVFTDPNFAGNDETGNQYEYPGYMQFQIVVYNSYGDIVDPSTVVESVVLRGQTTAYNVGDTFRFDGEVVVTYQSGDSKVVAPTSVSSPDMSTAGKKTVTVTYVTEEGQTFSKGYSIDVTYPDSRTAKTITYASGFNHEAIAHIDLANSALPDRAEPGSQVTMTVAIEDGYRFGCYYPNDEIGDVWEQFYDEVVRTKTVTFTMPDYSFEMILIVEVDDGSPIPDYPMKLEASGYSTKYYQYDDYSFDGTCTVTLESGATKTVTPRVKDYPNMSQLGKQTVTLEYEENNVTVRTSIEITVVERPATPKYQVTTQKTDGIQFTNLKATSTTGGSVALNEVEEGFRVSFNITVDGGYTLGTVYYICDGVKTTVNKGMSGTYSFYMPAGNVTIGAEVTAPSVLQNLNGIFGFQKDDHNVYEFCFNSSTKTGTYTRTNTNSGGTNVWTLNFSFSYSAGKVTLTLVSFEGSADNTSFEVGYRLFSTGERGATNESLSINEEGNTITLTMFGSSASSSTESHSFYQD